MAGVRAAGRNLTNDPREALPEVLRLMDQQLDAVDGGRLAVVELVA